MIMHRVHGDVMSFVFTVQECTVPNIYHGYTIKSCELPRVVLFDKALLWGGGATVQKEKGANFPSVYAILKFNSPCPNRFCFSHKFDIVHQRIGQEFHFIIYRRVIGNKYLLK